MNFLIADDHPIYRKGLIDLLTTVGEGVRFYEASTGIEVLDLLAVNTIDIIILDIRMPVLDGYATFLKIIERYPSMKVLVNSVYYEEHLVLSFIKDGVNGYILKTDDRIIDAVNLILSGRYYFSKELESIVIKAQRSLRDFDPIGLNSQEKKMIQLLAMGMNSQEIADRLTLTKHTIETYRKRLIRKFGVSNTTHLVKVVLGSGLM